MEHPPARAGAPAGRPGRARVHLDVEGIVQGVGFRPFVYRLATALRLGGLVGNDASGVFVELEGSRSEIDAFCERLVAEQPPLARIEAVRRRAARPLGTTTFSIAPSEADNGRHDALVSPDMATCPACLAELFDPGDRRYRYAFTNCTNCGPRFTIVDDVPYDRARTTMAGFSMCAACAREYGDPANRRFHAEPVCCPDCGPSLTLSDPDGAPIAGDPIEAAAGLLAGGAIVAVKGLGGFHLAADASSEPAVASLRRRKVREHKPFAVMVADLSGAMDLCHLEDPAVAAISSPRRPIVIAEVLESAALAPSVAPGRNDLGVMLAYTPLHHLLLAATNRPLVMTSGNRSDEPIAYRDATVRAELGGIADAFLGHDRPIRIRTDDSVVRAPRGASRIVRRAPGESPDPLALPVPTPVPLLALGAELKSTICLATGARAYLSHHLGDLEHASVLEAFDEAVGHFARLFSIEARVVVHDMHPEYLSTKRAETYGLECLAVQHHHAHIASCLADNGATGPVVGVAFDGTGYGTDGTLWGGELLVADLRGARRAGHLAPIRLPGGLAAIRAPWRMAAAYLAAGGIDPAGLTLYESRRGAWHKVLAIGAFSAVSPQTTSAGRLFDAVGAILGCAPEIDYEGQTAVELEQLAARAPSATDPYDVAPVEVGDHLEIPGASFITRVVADLRTGADPAAIAARFQLGLAHTVARCCMRIASTRALGDVALSGGVFQNVAFSEALAAAIERAGLGVLRHRDVPPNDGGIALGQAAIAAARLADRAAGHAR